MTRLRIDILAHACVDAAEVHAGTVQSDVWALHFGKQLEVLRCAISDEKLEVLLHGLRRARLEADSDRDALARTQQQVRLLDSDLVLVFRHERTVKDQ